MRRGNGLLMLFFAAFPVAAGGCATELSPEAKQQLAVGKAAYETDDDRQAVATLDRFLEAHGDAREAAQAYYYRGLARYRMERYGPARADLAEALDRARDDELRLFARIALADLAYDTGDMSTARERYEQALDAIEPGEAPADHVHYRLGRVLQRQGRWDDAELHFRRVVHYFPAGELARRAERLAPSRAWTVQAGAFESEANARKAAEVLQSAGLRATVTPSLQEGDLMFLVNVGRYNSYEGARAMLPNVRARRADAFITTLR